MGIIFSVMLRKLCGLVIFTDAEAGHLLDVGDIRHRLTDRVNISGCRLKLRSVSVSQVSMCLTAQLTNLYIIHS
jgi:hypothetical protein